MPYLKTDCLVLTFISYVEQYRTKARGGAGVGATGHEAEFVPS